MSFEISLLRRCKETFQSLNIYYVYVCMYMCVCITVCVCLTFPPHFPSYLPLLLILPIITLKLHMLVWVVVVVGGDCRTVRPIKKIHQMAEMGNGKWEMGKTALI